MTVTTREFDADAALTDHSGIVGESGRSPWHSKALVRASLEAELDTHWLPDPWQWSDLAYRTWHRDDLASAVCLLTVPLIDKSPLDVPILDEASQLELLQGVLSLLASSDSHLSPGVLAYRYSPAVGIEHYRAALARRVEMEAELRQTARFVARVDVASFFPSVTLRVIEATYALDAAAPSLHQMLRQLQYRLGYVLPEGYAASRALSNFCLRPVDGALNGRPFTRWVDDFRIFAPTECSAWKAVDAVRGAVVRLGLQVSDAKTAVQRAAVDVNDLVSVVGHTDGEHLTPTSDRFLRYAIRRATDNGDVSLLSELLGDGTNVPAAAIPRVAQALATFPNLPTRKGIIAALLAAEDELAGWRCGRLAYALWHWPTLDVVDYIPLLRQRFEVHTAIRPILLRCFARHAPDLAMELIARDVRVSARCREWVHAEAAGERRDPNGRLRPPPVASFL